MLHYEQVFGNVFERRESKCYGVLMKHRCKVKGEQAITLQMARQLKTKYINVAPGQLFCRQCKAQTSRKKLQLIGMSPVSLHAFTKTLKSDISEACKVKANSLKIPGLSLMIKMI